MANRVKKKVKREKERKQTVRRHVDRLPVLAPLIITATNTSKWALP